MRDENVEANARLVRRLSRCHSISDLQKLARKALPRPVFDYLEGGAEDEVTAARNIAAFDEAELAPRCLVDVSAPQTSVEVLGQRLEWPLFCSPTGGSRIYHPDGELAVARACERAGALFGLSIASTYSLEDVAAASAAPKLFQLYVFKDRGLTSDLIERCKAAGYSAICLTVDSAVRGKRERELRTGLGIPFTPSLRAIIDFAPHPRWLIAQMRRGPISMPTFRDYSGADDLASHSRYIDRQLDASVSWRDLEQFASQWGGAFALKGVMTAGDAKQALDCGVSDIIVSNHGGRQLDGAAATFAVLPVIAEAVADRASVILDGGVRRGSHILKALARGARACSIGRPYLYGLAAGGQSGVERALAILRSEFVRSMQLAGFARVADIDASALSAETLPATARSERVLRAAGS